MKFLICCKKCGNILMKSTEIVLAVLRIKIKCPNCKKVLNLPEDALIHKEGEGGRPGLT